LDDRPYIRDLEGPRDQGADVVLLAECLERSRVQPRPADGLERLAHRSKTSHPDDALILPSDLHEPPGGIGPEFSFARGSEFEDPNDLVLREIDSWRNHDLGAAGRHRSHQGGVEHHTILHGIPPFQKRDRF
jgi:hypothetical protein